jgi:hypothetical protein
MFIVNLASIPISNQLNMFIAKLWTALSKMGNIY